MPRLPREMKRRWKAQKVTPFAELPIGTAIATSRERLQTVANVANGCGRSRTVAQRLANTAQPPHPQSETGTLATHSGKKQLVYKSEKIRKKHGDEVEF